MCSRGGGPGLWSMPPRAHPARGENCSHRMAPGVGTRASAGVDSLGIQIAPAFFKLSKHPRRPK